MDVYGIGRTTWRGYDINASNVGIFDAYIKRMMRWRVLEPAAGRAVSLLVGTKEH
jgi:hypothetical protein